MDRSVFFLGIIIYLFNGVSFAIGRSGYLLTLPQELQIGANERFCLSLYNVSFDVDITVNITCYGRDVRHQPPAFKQGQGGCFIWRIPESLAAGKCDFRMIGGGGSWEIDDTRPVDVVDTHQITYIQTDKPLYKPGDKVRIRVLTVTQDLLPIQDKVEHVTVIDPNGIYMKQWTRIPVQNGLLNLEYRLYAEPLLGNWSIEARVNGRTTVQNFIIKKYVLPRFQVDATLPDGLTVDTKSIDINICAKYTFGKVVEGTVNASVCLQNQETNWYCLEQQRPCVNFYVQLRGCHQFNVETSRLNLTDRTFSLLCRPRLRLDVNVTEKHTGVTVHDVFEGPGVWEERVKMQILSDKHFRPFFPYVGKVHVWKPDGSPSIGERIEVAVNELGISVNLVTDTSGHAHFTLQNLTQATPYFVINARSLDKEYTDNKIYTIYPAKARRHVKQWFSRSLSYVQLYTSYRERRHCGDNVQVHVTYSLRPEASIASAYYQLISKGNILQLEDITSNLTLSRTFRPRTNGVLLTASVGAGTQEDIDFFPDDNYGVAGPPVSEGKSYLAGPPGSEGAKIGPPGRPGSEGRGTGAPIPPFQNLELDDKKESISTQIEEDTSKPAEEFIGLSPPALQEFTISQVLTMTMTPKLRILVYMATLDGEIVADSIDLDIMQCHSNKVQMSLDRSSARPGENVKVTMVAAADSLCAATMADRAVYIAGGLNILREEHVNKRLEEYDATSDFINDWKYCSDASILPPEFADQYAAPPFPPGAPGSDWFQFSQDAPKRKKRNIMQYYSNMYDSLLAFKRAGMAVLTDLDLLTRPCLHTGDALGPPHFPGDPRGPIPAEGGSIHALDLPQEPYDTQAPVSNLRRHFPETWLWELYEIPANGNVTFTERMPDTITEWVGNTVCLHESAGLEISDVASVTGYQPFFVDVKLPYSAVRGELLTVDVSVFNYLPHCVAVQVDIIEGAWFILEPHEDNQFCICSNAAQAYTFKIRPHTLGRNSITVSAFLREHRVSCHSTQSPPGFSNKRATELLVRDILVQAEGFEEEKTLSKFICPQDSTDGVYSEVLQPDIPDTDYIVPGSLRGWVNIVGDILGPVLGGLEDIVQLPTGCGEQNLIRLAPNIAVLRYLTATGQITNDIELKTISHLEKGYQQQLQFLHTDGSYSAFGSADDKGSTWLTAFVFKTLAHAQEFIYIDRKNIQTKSWEFLLNKQGEDGCFYERGKVLSKYMMGGVCASQEDHKRALTAYVLTAMLESFQMMRERTPPFVALAVRCIQVEDLTDTYTHALVAYAMALYKPTSRFTSIIIDNLREKAIVRGDTMHWRREKHPDILSGQGRAASAEVEITAYALLAILSQDKNAAVGEIIPIVRWLTSQRNSYGGFASTQDTVVALQALALFSRRVYGDGIDVKVSLTDENSASLDFHVLHSNRIILQRRDLPNPGSQLTLNAKGEGCILFQWTSRYNVENKVLPDDVFNVSVTTPVTKSIFQKECKGRTIHICASYHGKDYLSNMVIVEVRIPTGWRCDMETLQQYSNQVKLGLKKYEVNKEFDNVINFYFEEMDKTDRCFDIQVYQETVTEDNKAAVVRVIDYYESGQQTAMFYKMSECTEENVKDIDVNIDTEKGESDDSDIFFNGDRINAVLDQASNPVDNDGDGAAAPPTSKSTCPSCHVSGIVNILSDICTRQVWLLEPNGGNFMLRIIAGDGVSPPLEILLPNSVQFCTDCQPFVRDQGMKSIMLVNPYDWSDLGANIMQSSTKIIPWSESLEAALLGILKQCVKH